MEPAKVRVGTLAAPPPLVRDQCLGGDMQRPVLRPFVFIVAVMSAGAAFAQQALT